MSAPRRVHPGLALCVAVLAVSTGSLFFLLAHAPHLVVAFYRCALSTVILALIGWRACSREWPTLGSRERWYAVGAGLALALHFAAWFASLSRTSVASSVVLVNTTPLWVGLLTPLLSSDRLKAGTLSGIALSVVGGVVIGWGDFQLAGEALWGDFLALVGAWACALYMFAGRKLRASLSLLPYVVACYGTAALFLLVFVLASGQSILGYEPSTYGWMLALAVGPQLIGHSSYNYALRYVSAAMTSIASLGEAIVAPLLAWAVLGHVPPSTTLVGGAIVLAGVAVAIRAERSKA